MPQTLQLLKNLVNINSGSHNEKGVRQTGELLQKGFESIGFRTEWVPLPEDLKRAGHLVATRKGTKGKKLLLIGHLDTVFEPEAPAGPFRILNDSTATGQGINDMKGGDVLIWAALLSLEQTGFLTNTAITAYFTCDEELGGQPAAVSRRDLIERSKQHDYALAFETAQGLHTVVTGRRGTATWELKVKGEQGHSAGVFSQGYGAIYEAARIVNTFREELAGERYLTFNPGFFSGGSEVSYDSTNIKAAVSGKTNIISPLAIVRGDLRYLKASQKEKAIQNMNRIATTNHLSGSQATISFVDGIPAMEPVEGNAALVNILNKVSLDLRIGGVRAGDPGSRGAGDISYVAGYTSGALDGLGASGQGAHAAGETIHLNEYEKLIQRAAIFIYRLTRP